MLFVHIATDKVIDSTQPFTVGDVQYPANWLSTPQAALDLGLEELVRINEPPPDPENYFSNETREGKYATTTYTRKSDEQIAQIAVNKIDAAILDDEIQNPVTQRGLAELVIAIAKQSGLSDAQILALPERSMARRALERELRQTARRAARKALTG